MYPQLKTTHIYSIDFKEYGMFVTNDQSQASSKAQPCFNLYFLWVLWTCIHMACRSDQKKKKTHKILESKNLVPPPNFKSHRYLMYC